MEEIISIKSEYGFREKIEKYDFIEERFKEIYFSIFLKIFKHSKILLYSSKCLRNYLFLIRRILLF